jgi:hypothetical protein
LNKKNCFVSWMVLTIVARCRKSSWCRQVQGSDADAADADAADGDAL